MFNFKFAWDAMGQIIREGLPVSVEIVFWTVLISMPLGFFVGVLRYRRVKIITPLFTVLISFFRGVPMVILIFLFYSALPDVLMKLSRAYNWGINFYNINKVALAIFLCCTFTVAIMSEIFRSALSAVNPNQLEAAHSCGLSTFQAYIHVIIPQALVSAIPNLGNNIINLFKGTALVFYMGIADIMGVAKTAAGISYNYLEAYVDVFILYVAICFIMQKFFQLLERWLGAYRAA